MASVTDHHEGDLGDALPHYELEAEIGRGAFGVVYGARDRRLGRPVAIKQLHARLAGDAGIQSRFLIEARALASLDYPHIVSLYEFVEIDGVCVIVMEKLEGGSLEQRFRECGIDAQAACAITLAVCSALKHAHARGVIHRDVKPENVLFASSGAPKVADFGVAKIVGGSDVLTTVNGLILGSPAYMAPEQALGKTPGPAFDVYATGTMLYYLLSGRFPYGQEGGGVAIMHRHIYEEPLPLRSAAPFVSKGLSEVVMRAFARETADRWASAEDFGVALGRAATREFGPGWLGRSGVSVMAQGPILASVTTSEETHRRWLWHGSDSGELVFPLTPALPLLEAPVGASELMPLRVLLDTSAHP